MWSTPGNIKTTAASIKKFYKSMFEHGYIEKADYNFLCSEIKENMVEHDKVFGEITGHCDCNEKSSCEK